MTARAASAQASLAIAPPEGVHLRMPASVYEDAPAIGADDLRLLYWDPTSWWAQSSHNPYRKARRRGARQYHRSQEDALRILVTQGEDAYVAAFAIEPDDGRSGWGRNRDDARALLRERGVEIPRGDFTDATVTRLIRKHGLAHRFFPVARLDYEAARRAGRRHLTEDDDRRIRQTARIIRAHKLGSVLSDGLCDTAVLWRREEDPDTLLRARFDYLRPRRILEIVKVASGGARDIDGAIRRTIEDGDLEISRRLLDEAWTQLVHFVAEGRVFAWDETGGRAQVLQAERALLESYTRDASPPEFVWIFTQLPVDEVGAERGAIIAPRWHRPEGQIWDSGGAKIAAGIGAYRDFAKRQSLDRPWFAVDDVKELIDADVRVRVKREVV